ncbi:MAG: serine/threonine-protein kinase [Pirellulales bacterium]|nr:serine/threonine-protein kinase [Pirellulales bacterium]
MLTLSQLQAKELAGKRWHLNGEAYAFADYDRNSPGQPPWKTGAEGIAYPLLNGDGTPGAYVKFFDELKISPKRVRRTQWLIDQRVDTWADELRGAPGTWVDTKSDGSPDGIGFEFTCSLAEAVPGRTWLELKLDVIDGVVRLNDDLRRRCVENLLRGLVFLERKRLVHGDLSPNNIIVDIDAQPGNPALYLIDFDAFLAPDTGDLASLSAAEGGTFGTQGYCPPALEQFAHSDPSKAAPYSDRFARDMLLLELICFDFDCDFEEPPGEWSRDLLLSRLSASSLGRNLPHLRDERVFRIPEQERPEAGDLSRGLGISTPPRVKPPSVSQRYGGGEAAQLLNVVENWLRRGIAVLWFLCQVHVLIVGFALTGLLLDDAPAGTSIGNWLRLATRLLITVGVFVAALVPLSMLAFSERQERVMNLVGVWVRLPPRRNQRRRELVHLGMVIFQLSGVLTLLVTWAYVVSGS